MDVGDRAALPLNAARQARIYRLKTARIRGVFAQLDYFLFADNPLRAAVGGCKRVCRYQSG
jgi:hypothetical protein